MQTNSPTAAETKFSKEAIYAQLQKIFKDAYFAKSDILRRFLLFIVDQTLLGHEHWLKEYTIGINVLNKPPNFKPQENGIVRIHAGRLRRALHNYYNSSGAYDVIYISIPKGSYVPVFEEINDQIIIKHTDKISVDDINETLAQNAVIAVVPFQHFTNKPLENLLADGLGLQLSTVLMQCEKFSVVAYYAMRNLFKKVTDITAISSAIGARYLITGEIQSVENRVRIHSQLINAHTNQQLSSWMHEGNLAAENIFELQDEIVKLIIAELNPEKFISKKGQNVRVMAVA